jgi:hypothetical protein
MFPEHNLLNADVIEQLQLGGFLPLHIEFLGWLSGYASALNNSKNACRAGHTILGKNEAMFDTFIAKKQDSVAPRRVTRDDHHEIDKKARKLQKYLDQLAEQVPNDGDHDKEDL